MGNEIKVNEYARTFAGYIFKVLKISEEDKLIYYYGDQPEWIGEWKENIIKHSSNLIDLIQVGDMVHTKDVLNEDWYWMFDEEMVKATKETIEQGINLVEIVTKEMMESISYKV